MATTNLNTLSIRHSKNIGDPVSAADGDGKRWTSAQRTVHINEAVRRWLRKEYIAGTIRESRTQDPKKAWDSLGSYLVKGAVSVSAGSKSLTDFGGAGVSVAWFVSNGANSTDAAIVKRLPFNLLPYCAAGLGQSYFAYSTTNQYFYVSDGTFYLLGATSPSNIAIWYIKQHTDLTVVTGDGGTDIAVPSHSWDQIIDLAYKVAMEEVADSESAAKSILKEQAVNGEIA